MGYIRDSVWIHAAAMHGLRPSTLSTAHQLMDSLPNHVRHDVSGAGFQV